MNTQTSPIDDHHPQTVITYSQQPRGASIDLCATHAEIETGLIQVHRGQHIGQCARCVSIGDLETTIPPPVDGDEADGCPDLEDATFPLDSYIR